MLNHLEYLGGFLLPITEYTIWIGGERSWQRTYLGEIGAVELTDEQIEKFFTFNEEGEIEFDSALISEKVHSWGEENPELPTWDTITDGCLGWGAYTDQYVGVCDTEDDENPLLLTDVETLGYYTEEEIVDGLPVEDEQESAICEYVDELDEPDGVWMLYHSIEKGGYEGSFELPDGEEFDPKKLVIKVRQIADRFSIVTGASYNGEDIEMTGDSDGKGIDWYIYYNGELFPFG